MKITVIGTGYVGLVSGACLADVGNQVLCFDLDAKKIATLTSGEIPIYEPGLKQIVANNVAAGRLTFTTSIEESVAFGDIQMIAVGTPPGEDGSADLQYVVAAARNIGRHMTAAKIVIDKSTVPVGTADLVQEAIAGELATRNLDMKFSVVSNPEFLKEGAAIEDFMRPDRIVIGVGHSGQSNSSANIATVETLRILYAPFQRSHDRLMIMDVRSAELTKYAANAMLATRISFMNELALLAEKLGADIESVRKGMGSDPRIGYHFLYPGIGYGGSCFPKDVQALQRTGTAAGIEMKLLDAVERVNFAQKHVLTQKIIKQLGEDLTGKTIALWGLAFKPNTDDMREAPALVLIDDLTLRGARVVAFDPVAMTEAARILKNNIKVSFAADAMAVLAGADALAIVTEWKAFRAPDFAAMKTALKSAVIFDGRNLYEPEVMAENGFRYFPIGRKQAV